MSFQDFEAALFFFFEGVLIGIELLDEHRAVKIVVGNGGILEGDGYSIIPSAVFGAVIPRNGHADPQHTPQLDLFGENRIMVFLEERQEFLGVPPLGLVVVLNHVWLIFSIGSRATLRPGSSDG